MPSFCTVAAHVMVNAKPPSARLTSHRYSASPSRPSSWLCPLVIGASTNRFLSAPPRVRESESVSCVMGLQLYPAPQHCQRTAEHLRRSLQHFQRSLQHLQAPLKGSPYSTFGEGIVSLPEAA